MLTSSSRLQEVKSDLLDKLQQIKDFYSEETVCSSIQELLTLLKGKINDEELTKRLHRLRVPLQKLLKDERYDDKHPAKTTLLNCLQLMTFISPINDAEDDGFISIITLEKFPDTRIYYATSGHMIHYRDMHMNPEQTVAMIAGQGLSDVEKSALGVYIFQQGLYPTSLLTNAFSSYTLKATLQSLLMLYLIVSYTQECSTDPSYLANINWLHSMIRMTAYPFELIHTTIWPIASLYTLSEGMVSCIYNSFTNPIFMLKTYAGSKAIGFFQQNIAEYLSEREFQIDTPFKKNTIMTDLSLAQKIPQWTKRLSQVEKFCEMDIRQREGIDEVKISLLNQLYHYMTS